jgi:hypothetical protein
MLQHVPSPTYVAFGPWGSYYMAGDTHSYWHMTTDTLEDIFNSKTGSFPFILDPDKIFLWVMRIPRERSRGVASLIGLLGIHEFLQKI